MMQLIPIEEVYVEALQVKHPIIDWKVHKEGQRSHWKIIRLGGSSAYYQFFVDVLKHLDREDLNQLWILVKEYLSIRPASSDKEMELWVELKRLDCQRQRDLHASREGLSSEEGSSTFNDLLQASKITQCVNSLEDPNLSFQHEYQAWVESSSDSDQEINANMVFMAQIKKVLSDSEASSSSADEKISEVSYYLSESESESYENFIENHIDSQKDYDKSDVDHNDSEEKDQLVDKLIQKFNHKIAKCQKRIEKANQQSKDFENKNKDLQDKYDVLKNQTTTFEMNNKELNEQLKEFIEKNNDLIAQTK
nr:hypothetical protein [Tanacetum cinerariifolium]